MNASSSSILASPLPLPPRADLTPAFVAGQNLRRLRRAVSMTPGRLRLALTGIWAFSVLTLLAALVGIDRHRHEMQTIGKDSAPSIIAAQDIRTSLADMQISVARQLLGGDDAGVTAGDTYESRRRSATTALVTAAENITYGDAERVPIRNLLFGIGSFEREVARARTLRDRHDPGYLTSLREAERILHEELLPAADALDKANLEALENGYNAEQSSSSAATAGLIVTGLALLGLLIATQVFLVRRTRRLLNPALLGASLATVALVASLIGGFRDESHDLKIAKEDSFDSIHALWRARSYAYDARGYQLLGLADPQRADALSPGFSANSARIITLSNGEMPGSVMNEVEATGTAKGFTGCLADELNNITFVGEREAAIDTLRGYLSYLASSEAATRLAAGGNNQGIDLALSNSAEVSRGDTATADGNQPLQGGSYAFSRFDAALGQTLAINQREFDSAVDRGMQEMQGRWLSSSITLAAVAVLGYLGLRPRLKEYAP